MRYAVLADIHGNLDALRAALAVSGREGAERFLVLGDLVGYGPRPNECVELIGSLDATCVAGNHDLIALGQLSDEHCIPIARESLRWTRRIMAPSSRAFLEGLPLTASAPFGAVLAHGSLEDPQTYTASPREALTQLDRLLELDDRAELLLLGHTHRPLAVSRRRGQLAPRGVVRFDAGDATLLNPGAVGQSRELLARVRLLVLEPASRRAWFIRVAYDARAPRAALRAEGLSPRGLHLHPRPRRIARVMSTEARLLGRRVSRRSV